MKVKIYWQWDESQELLNKVNNSLEDLWLSDFMEVEVTLDENLKNELSISKEPALIIEEEAIDFKDTIFEWIIPDIHSYHDKKYCILSNYVPFHFRITGHNPSPPLFLNE